MTDLDNQQDASGTAARTVHFLALLSAFLIPLKLSIAYAATVPFVISTLYFFNAKIISSKSWRYSVVYPLLVFFFIIFISSSLGINPTRSLGKFPTFIFSILLLGALINYVQIFGWKKLVLASLLGQTLAGIHTVVDGALVGDIPRLFLGAVTESGQLALQIPFALGLLGYYVKSEGLKLPKLELTLATLFAASLTTLGFYESFSYHDKFLYILLPLTILITGIIGWRLFSISRDKKLEMEILLLLIIPVTCSAMLINLKRGPWLGVLVSCLVLAFIYARRLLPFIISIASILAIVFKPIRERILQSWDHFTISGGRSEMWEIGIELSSRFPTGIGWHNSSFLRSFSNDIPPEHNHFHNNLLNILVEVGWLGLAIYTWWLISIFRASFKQRINLNYFPLKIAIGSALLSWQVAGLVEYNFGDSEVLMVALLYIAILAVTSQQSQESINKPALTSSVTSPENA